MASPQPLAVWGWSCSRVKSTSPPGPAHHLPQHPLELREGHAAVELRQLEHQVVSVHYSVTSTVPATGT